MLHGEQPQGRETPGQGQSSSGWPPSGQAAWGQFSPPPAPQQRPNRNATRWGFGAAFLVNLMGAVVGLFNDSNTVKAIFLGIGIVVGVAVKLYLDRQAAPANRR